MKFLAISTNTADPTAFIADESAQMARLEASGFVEHVYLKADWSGAVLVVEAEDEDAAKQQLGSLPLVRHAVTTFGLTALAPNP